MQLLGIGFAKKSWISLTKKLQKQLTHQLNSELFNDQRLNSDIEIKNKDFKNIIIDLFDLKPDWIIFSKDYFKNTETIIRLMDSLRTQSEKKINFVISIRNFKQNMNSFLKYIPEFELVNKMHLKISAQELILEKNIKTFPRIRINSEFYKINYRNNYGEKVKHSSDEIPLNSLISLKSIEKFETYLGEFKPIKWLENVLKKKNASFKINLVGGILRESKGCYLFPGIPFNSILNVKINNLKIDHFICLDECEKNNPPFKRLVKKMKEEYRNWLKENKDYSKVQSSLIYCLMKQSVIKNILENMFKELGLSNIRLISENNSVKNFLKANVNRLNLEDSFFSESFESNVDWKGDLKKIISPLKKTIDLKELEVLNRTKYMPIHKTELEENLKNFYIEEIKIQKLIKKFEIEKTICTQELDFMKNLNVLTKILIKVLACSINWEEAHKKVSEIKKPKILLFSGEESSAAELNLKLTEVSKKLWINPFKFEKTDDLIQLNSEMIRSYLLPEAVIINPLGKKHLENLCEESIKEYQIAKKNYNEKNLKIKHSKTDLGLIKKNKKNLALRWLTVSVKQLLYRDRHLFKSNSKKIV